MTQTDSVKCFDLWLQIHLERESACVVAVTRTLKSKGTAERVPWGGCCEQTCDVYVTCSKNMADHRKGKKHADMAARQRMTRPGTESPREELHSRKRRKGLAGDNKVTRTQPPLPPLSPPPPSPRERQRRPPPPPPPQEELDMEIEVLSTIDPQAGLDARTMAESFLGSIGFDIGLGGADVDVPPAEQAWGAAAAQSIMPPSPAEPHQIMGISGAYTHTGEGWSAPGAYGQTPPAWQ